MFKAILGSKLIVLAVTIAILYSAGQQVAHTLDGVAASISAATNVGNGESQ